MENIKRQNLSEPLIVFAGVMIAIKVLYEFRAIPWVGSSLSTLVAALLIYVPIFHVSWKRLPVRFFERGKNDVFRSFSLFLIVSAIIFPPFLILNHFYQKLVFELDFHLVSLAHPFSLMLTQIFLVALPEEFFFRGYLQSLLQIRFPREITLFKRLSLNISWAIPLSAFLFAFSHSLITLRWWHFSIFFPALIFGWLRQKTRGLVAPILFHALSNILVSWIGAAYF